MMVEQEQRHIYYDRDLEIEAYQLSGIVQKFPNHFHEYYVIGSIEGGKRHLWCRGQEYDLNPGDLVLFNPRDNHCCAPVNGELLDYRGINVGREVMEKAVREITGREYALRFSQNVVYQSEVSQSVRELYDAILEREEKMKKEEIMFFLLEQILRDHAAPFEETGIVGPETQIQTLCTYMEEHFAENMTLDELLSMTNFSKSYLLRAFTKQVGVSPYRYLQTVRLERAKKLLEQGTVPAIAAAMAGFSDQSHFTNYFKEFIGLTPRQYQRIFTDEAPDAGPVKEL